MCSPGFDFGPGVLDGQEPVGVQALITEVAVEAFDECIIGWLSWTVVGVRRFQYQQGIFPFIRR